MKIQKATAFPSIPCCDTEYACERQTQPAKPVVFQRWLVAGLAEDLLQTGKIIIYRRPEVEFYQSIVKMIPVSDCQYRRCA